MNRIDRITAILIQLQSRKIVKANDIADRFDISLRTVYRDIRTLEKAGVPIIGEAGVGYSIMDGYRLPPVMFSKEEATAFITAEKLVDKMADSPTADRYKDAMYKLRSVLRSEEKGMLEDIEDVIYIHKYKQRNKPKYMYEVLKSISDEQAVQLEYEAGYKQEVTTRTVEPVGIYFISDNWHLVGWCKLRNDYRDFRLDRIRCLSNTAESFEQEKIRLDEYVRDYLNRNCLIEVQIRFNKQVAPFIEEQRLYYGYVSEQEDGAYVVMRFLTSSIFYFSRWVISFGKMAEVITPDELRKSVKDLIKELQEHYS